MCTDRPNAVVFGGASFSLQAGFSRRSILNTRLALSAFIRVHRRLMIGFAFTY
jgi:hypothetical protein